MPYAAKRHNQRQGPRQDNRRAAGERGYDWDWAKLAMRHKREYPLCQACLELGFVVPAEITDHIVPVHVRPDLRMDWGNLQSLCRGCHKKKTDEDVRKYGAAK